MTTALQTFHTEFGEHQAQLTIIDVRGEPWFKGKEAAAALGYKNLNQAISNKVECEDKDNLENLGGLVTRPLTNPNEGACIYISESGLYSLIMGSRLPHAKAFKRWVLREVLPSIRRTGQFSTLQELPAHWEAHRAKLDALASAQALAHAAGVPLGGGHQKAISDAVHAVLLPAGRQQEDMIDAAEFLRRKGHAQEEIRRLASQFGKALKAAWTHTRNDQVVTNCRNGPGANDVRMYHAQDDAIFLDETSAPTGTCTRRPAADMNKCARKPHKAWPLHFPAAWYRIQTPSSRGRPSQLQPIPLPHAGRVVPDGNPRNSIRDAFRIVATLRHDSGHH